MVPFYAAVLFFLPLAFLFWLIRGSYRLARHAFLSQRRSICFWYGVVTALWVHAKRALLVTRIRWVNEDLEANRYGALGESKRAPFIRERLQRLEGKLDALDRREAARVRLWESILRTRKE